MIIAVEEIGEPRALTCDEKTGEKNTTRGFRVITNDPTNDPFIALTPPQIPLPYAPHPSYAGCKVVHRRANQGEDHTVWMVDIDYSNRYWDEAAANVDPRLRPVQISIDSVEYQHPLEREVEPDTSGAAILNSVGEKFETPVTVSRQRRRLTITKNFISDGRADILGYENSINLFTWFDEEPLTVCFSGFRSQRQFEDEWGAFWARTYIFDVMPSQEDPEYDAALGFSPWDARPLDCGYYYLDPFSLELFPSFDRAGQPKKILLNGEGFALDLGEAPVYLRFKRHLRQDFSEIL